MKLNENDYIRTKDGIIDKVIIEYHGICNSPNCNCKHVSCKHDYYDEDTIIKSSPNIIDLIEVGDYVNEQLVTSAEEVVKNDDRYIGFGNYDYYISTNKDIKSIVTKEMYSSVEYRVESN